MIRQKSFDTEKPTLYIVATPIGNLDELSPRAIDILNHVDIIAAEDTRNTKKLLMHFNITTKCIAHHQHNEEISSKGLMKLLEEGKSIALVSDAGYPLISDPGQCISKSVSDAGFAIVPISGSNACLNALVASTLDTYHFLFYGFLSSQAQARNNELIALLNFPYTLVFYEAPHRIKKSLNSMLSILGDRNICLGREITKKHEEFLRGKISEILEVVDTLKGEMVVVVEGNSNEATEATLLSPEEMIDKVNEYQTSGCSIKEAMKKVAIERGVSKNDVYRIYHELD